MLEYFPSKIIVPPTFLTLLENSLTEIYIMVILKVENIFRCNANPTFDAELSFNKPIYFLFKILKGRF